MNVMDLVKSQLGGSVLSQLAGAMGTDTAQTRRATEAAAPALLAALAGAASTSEGARKLDAAVEAVDDPNDALDSLSRGGVQSIERGSNMLSSLLGAGTLSNLGSVLSRFTGMGGGTIASLLGVCGPMILGLLKRQKQSLGLDASGLAGLLSSQKSNIAAAMPVGLGGMLGNIPGLSGLGDWASGAGSRAAGAARDAVETTREYANAAHDGGRAATSSVARWAIPLVVLLALGALGWWAMSSGRRTAPQASAPISARSSAPEAPLALTDAGAAAQREADATLAAAKVQPTEMLSSLSTKATDAFRSATESFSGITDAASAEAAIPKLKELPDKLGSIATGLSALSTDNRSQFMETLRPLVDKLNLGIDKALLVPGVSDKIRPYVTPIREKLAAFSTSAN